MFLSVLYTIFSICFVLVSIALVHEFGHYITAKLSGIWVLEFAIGFGNRIWKKKIGETLYSIRPLPLGGFVRLVGMDNIEEETQEGEKPENPDPDLPLVPVDHPRSYVSRPAWAKVLVLAAGAMMNMVWALVLYVLIYLFSGVPITNIYVVDAIKDKAAYTAGVRSGDIITAINGQKLTDYLDGMTIIQKNAGKPITLSITRSHPINKSAAEGGILQTPNATNDGTYQIHDDEQLTITVTPDGAPGEVGKIGIALNQNIYDTAKFSFWKSFEKGIEDGFDIIRRTVMGLVKMFKRETTADVAGPVKIMKMIKDQSNKGIIDLMMLTAILSVNIGLLNILPFPVLDGGRIVFVLLGCVFNFINKIFHTKLEVNSTVEENIHFAGMIILLGLVVFVTYKDIASFF